VLRWFVLPGYWNSDVDSACLWSCGPSMLVQCGLGGLWGILTGGYLILILLPRAFLVCVFHHVVERFMDPTPRFDRDWFRRVVQVLLTSYARKGYLSVR
jgi:hypothetical protein